MATTDKKQKHIDEAVTWETERLVAASRSARTAWFVAAAGWVMALVAVIAIAGLTPLKQVEPFVVRVDGATGIVDVVSALKNSPHTYDAAVTRYFAAQYIYAREGYSRRLASSYYNRVGLMSTAPVAQVYFKDFSPQNPQSPLNLYGDRTQVQAEIVSISFISKSLVSVRFTKTIKYSNRPSEVSHWIATMGFQYVDAPMHESDRLVNPLGFQVTEYRVASEVVGGTTP